MARSRPVGVLALAVLWGWSNGAAAHDGTVGAGGGTVPLVAVVVAATLVGVVSGLVAVAWASERVRATVTGRRFRAALGVGLTALGVSFVVPVVGDGPTVAVLGAGAGLVLADRVPHRHAPATTGERSLAVGVVGAIALHRLFEGAALAAGLLAGSTVGVATAAVVTVHAAGETAAVGTLLAVAGRRPLAVGAVLAVQAGFLAAAGAATLAAVSVPPGARSVVVALAAGVLVHFGLHECRQCYTDWRTAT